jgi:hypothetical protein
MKFENRLFPAAVTTVIQNVKVNCYSCKITENILNEVFGRRLTNFFRGGHELLGHSMHTRNFVVFPTQYLYSMAFT